MLDAELSQEEERLRARYQAPVLARLEPYLQQIFPGGRIDLGDNFDAAGLTRGIRSEDMARLSEGTREQIAVLVRLGFAKLLADQGLGCPLVLDDALVYSDDQRISAMHRALEIAAAAHQVIVLTCREQSFAGLGGHRVSLTAWTP